MSSSTEKFLSSQESSQNNFLTPNKIPKKPHFRYVDFDNLRRTHYIKVKSWKFHSCNLSTFNSEFQYAQSNPGWRELLSEENQKFGHTLKYSTIKKSFKYIKRAKFSSTVLSKNRFFLQLCKTSKLETLNLLIGPSQKSLRMLKAFMNSFLKNVSLISECDNSTCNIDPFLISSFRRLRKASLFVSACRNRIKMLLDTDKLCPWNLQLQLTQINYHSILNQVMMVRPESIKKISYQLATTGNSSLNTNPPLPKLPNLQQLVFFLTASDNILKTANLFFVKQYSKLVSLSIGLENHEAETLDHLVDLPFLKELYLSFKQFTRVDTKKPLRRSFPNLTKLDKFGLYLDEPIIWTFDNAKNFIFQNRDLKSLDLSLSIQNLGSLLEENENFTLPNIEHLRLCFIRCEKPFVESANKIATALKRLSSVKKLEIEISKGYRQLNRILFKQGLAFMINLESLILKYQEFDNSVYSYNVFEHFREIFKNLPNLKAIDLNTGDECLMSEDVKSILKGFYELQNLEKLIFHGKALVPLKPEKLSQFSIFLITLRHLKDLYVSLIVGYNEDGVNTEFWGNLLPKSSLSNSSFISSEFLTF